MVLSFCAEPVQEKVSSRTLERIHARASDEDKNETQEVFEPYKQYALPNDSPRHERVQDATASIIRQSVNTSGNSSWKCILGRCSSCARNTKSVQLKIIQPVLFGFTFTNDRSAAQCMVIWNPRQASPSVIDVPINL
jgi:hypothetical protein